MNNGVGGPAAVICFLTQGALIWLEHQLRAEAEAPAFVCAPVECICAPAAAPQVLTTEVTCVCDFHQIQLLCDRFGPVFGLLVAGVCALQVLLRYLSRRAAAPVVASGARAAPGVTPRRALRRLRIADSAESETGSQSEVSGLLALHDAASPGPHPAALEDW